MEKSTYINWEKLAQISELKKYFAEDSFEFKQLIEEGISELSQFSEETLDKFAKLRVLETTNGCTQWGFRRGDENSLSVEQTRECMNLVMGFMKRVELYFPSEGKIEFNEKEKAYMKATRSLYQDAFKNNQEGAAKKFYAVSTALFIVCGRERMQSAMNLVKQDYQALFSPYYIEKGQKYLAPYLEALE